MLPHDVNNKLSPYPGRTWTQIFLFYHRTTERFVEKSVQMMKSSFIQEFNKIPSVF